MGFAVVGEGSRIAAGATAFGEAPSVAASTTTGAKEVPCRESRISSGMICSTSLPLEGVEGIGISHPVHRGRQTLLPVAGARAAVRQRHKVDPQNVTIGSTEWLVWICRALVEVPLYTMAIGAAITAQPIAARPLAVRPIAARTMALRPPPARTSRGVRFAAVGSSSRILPSKGTERGYGRHCRSTARWPRRPVDARLLRRLFWQALDPQLARDPGRLARSTCRGLPRRFPRPGRGADSAKTRARSVPRAIRGRATPWNGCAPPGTTTDEIRGKGSARAERTSVRRLPGRRDRPLRARSPDGPRISSPFDGVDRSRPNSPGRFADPSFPGAFSRPTSHVKISATAPRTGSAAFRSRRCCRRWDDELWVEFWGTTFRHFHPRRLVVKG